MKKIIVQMADRQWTLEATHDACMLARNLNGKVILLHLKQINNPGLLGWSAILPTHEEYQQISELATVAEDYGVEFCVQPMHFTSLYSALQQVVQELQADVLFAHLFTSKFDVWNKVRLERFQHQLGECILYTLDKEPSFNVSQAVQMLEAK